jgi:two-component sensor histidine kinase
MRQEVIIRSVLRRVGTPANLLMVGLLGGMFCLIPLLTRFPEPGVAELVLPFLLLFGHLALAPVPWQWTGDDRDRAGLGRGIIQALVFDLAWIALVLASMHLLGDPGPPRLQPEFPHGPPPPFFSPQAGPPAAHLLIRHPFMRGLGIGSINLAFGLAYGWVCAEKEATEARELQTAELLRQAQAKALQNQLEPHVLYNALNGLAELVHEDPLAAEEAIAKLADLYRMLTVHGNQARVRLGLERALVEAYLDMEQMRFGERLQVSWNWPGWADDITAPPLFLLPLVENAIKHGIGPAEAGGQVVITCLREGPAIRLVVENTGAPLEPESRRGVGLGNLEHRMALQTERSGRFTLAARGGWTEATVQFIPEAQ